jgi:GNAT superfamily N-acetyltransferase
MLLGKLMYEGYTDTIDYENETEGDFIAEIERTFEGQYGPCLYNSSFVIEDDSTPVATSIITLFKGVPLLTYTVTNPKHLNKGYSTYLIRRSMNELLVNGYEDLYLVVTIGNSSAIHIYEKLGFVEIFGEWEDILSKKIQN